MLELDLPVTERSDTTDTRVVPVASLEATPRQILTGDLAGLPAGCSVYIPYLPGGDFELTLRACERLLAQRLVPVPHLPARAVPSREQLHRWLAALDDLGCSSLFLIAGDLAEPVGPFADTLDLLDSDILREHGIRGLGIAGHPEGHPVANERALSQALVCKRAYATRTGTRMWLVTQFMLQVEPVVAWLESHRDLMGNLPVYIGVPGPASIATLMSYAAHCGVGASAKLVARRPKSLRMMAGWQPDDIVEALQSYINDPARLGAGRVRGVHLFPFGGIRRTLAWLGRGCLPGAGEAGES